MAIDQAAPNDADVVRPTHASHREVFFDAGPTVIEVPTNADAPLLIHDGTHQLTVSLPEGLEVADGQVAQDGSVVYTQNGDNAHAAVQPLNDGTVRLQTVLESSDAPSSYTYDFGNGTDLVLEPNGSVTVTTPNAGGRAIVTGMIDAPWAVDADGATVATRYSVEGSRLTQHVMHSIEHSYPITADPRVTLGWAIYVKYSRADVRSVTTGFGKAINDKAELALILCAKIPHWGAKAACGAIGKTFWDSIYNTFKQANKYKQCVEIQLAYFTHIPVVWKRYSC